MHERVKGPLVVEETNTNYSDFPLFKKKKKNLSFNVWTSEVQICILYLYSRVKTGTEETQKGVKSSGPIKANTDETLMKHEC